MRTTIILFEILHTLMVPLSVFPSLLNAKKAKEFITTKQELQEMLEGLL